MMKEYKLAKGWAVFIYLTTPLLMAVFGYLLLMPFLPGGEKDLQLYWFMAPISLGMIALCVIGIIDAVKGRFVIAGDRVYRKGVFRDRELLLYQIAGFRQDDKYIYIEPTEKSLKRIKISRYFGGTAEMLEWLSERYPDLDEQTAEAEKQEILSDNSLGYTVEQREEKLAVARKRAKALNWAGGLVAVWAFFFAQPYEAAILAAVVLPAISVLVSKYSGGLIRVEEKKGSAFPSVFSGVFFPAMALCLRALLDFNILRYENVWKATVLTGAVFMALLLVRSKEFLFQSAREYGVMFFFAVLAFAYGFGAVVTLNAVYDNSPAAVYQAQVTGKRISSGKSTTYYLTLTPWGPQKEADDVSVSKSLYNRLQVKDNVEVYLKKGWLGIPWFVVSE
jgi:hypothetical protein